MTLTTRILLVLALMAPVGLLAQETTATARPAETATDAAKAAATETTTAAPSAGEADDEPTSAYILRDRFSSVLRNHPPQLPMILKLDPSFLSNEAFLAGYPELAAFVHKHPQIQRNPHFYLAEFHIPGKDNTLERVLEMLAVFGGFGLAIFTFVWLVRTVVEQKRWSRLSRVQTEVHTKILDRFSTSQEVLDYIKTPAGTKFLESAPIPLHSDRVPHNAPVSRVLWSLQLGVVIAAGAAGMLLVSLRFSGENGQSLFALGAIAFCVGLGFIASAVVSLVMSRRLGLWPQESGATPPGIDDAGLVR